MLEYIWKYLPGLDPYDSNEATTTALKAVVSA